MKTTNLALPEIGLIAMTRGMLGVGIGLLAASRLGNDERKLVGRVLLTVGVLTTIPLVIDVVSRMRE